MHYSPSADAAATYVASHGPAAPAAAASLRVLYTAVLLHWFPPSRGFAIDHTPGAKPHALPGFLAVRHRVRGVVLVAGLACAAQWTPAGRADALGAIARHMDARGDLARGPVYALAGAGRQWLVVRVPPAARRDVPALVLDWGADIAGSAAYTQLQAIARIVDEECGGRG